MIKEKTEGALFCEEGSSPCQDGGRTPGSHQAATHRYHKLNIMHRFIGPLLDALQQSARLRHTDLRLRGSTSTNRCQPLRSCKVKCRSGESVRGPYANTFEIGKAGEVRGGMMEEKLVHYVSQFPDVWDSTLLV